MKKKMVIFLVLLQAITIPAYSDSRAIMPLDDLFWSSNAEIVEFNASVIASFSSNEETSFLFKNNETDALQFLSVASPIFINSKEYYFDKLSNKNIYIRDINGRTSLLKYDNSVGPSKLSEHDMNVSTLRQKAQSVLKMKKQASILYDNKKLPDSVREIAADLGLPKFLVNLLVETPAFARDKAGRPGFLLDERIPAIFYEISPFIKGDIVLTVDGIPVHDLDRVLDHVRSNMTLKEYAVEVQRNKMLRIIKVFMQ
jgi:hypothetical protein